MARHTFQRNVPRAEVTSIRSALSQSDATLTIVRGAVMIHAQSNGVTLPPAGPDQWSQMQVWVNGDDDGTGPWTWTISYLDGAGP